MNFNEKLSVNLKYDELSHRLGYSNSVSLLISQLNKSKLISQFQKIQKALEKSDCVWLSSLSAQIFEEEGTLVGEESQQRFCAKEQSRSFSPLTPCFVRVVIKKCTDPSGYLIVISGSKSLLSFSELKKLLSILFSESPIDFDIDPPALPARLTGRNTIGLESNKIRCLSKQESITRRLNNLIIDSTSLILASEVLSQAMFDNAATLLFDVCGDYEFEDKESLKRWSGTLESSQSVTSFKSRCFKYLETIDSDSIEDTCCQLKGNCQHLIGINHYQLDSSLINVQCVKILNASTHSLLSPLQVSLISDPKGEQIINVSYHSEYYDTQDIQSYLDSLLYIAKQLFDEKIQYLKDIKFIPPLNPCLIVEENEGDSCEVRNSCSLTQAFEKQVEQQSERIAVTFNNRHLTYNELNDYSNQLANLFIEELGVYQCRVGLKLERDEWMIVAMLAVLKTGSVYVPIDPATPVKRTKYICENSDIALLIDSNKIQEHQSQYELHQLSQLIERSKTYKPNAPVISESDNDAYIIYTSGSTGNPKGVSVPHGNVINLVEGLSAVYDFNENDVWSVFHSFAFDFSVWEIWGGLLTGGRLVIVPFDTSRDSNLFSNLVREQNITILSQTPSAFYQLQLTDDLGENCQQVRFVVFGGESLNCTFLRPWFEKIPSSQNCKLLNMYGITETTVHVTHREVTRQDSLVGSQSVGIPIRGWNFHILDELGRCLPANSIGEIYVSGSGLASEYCNQVELTKERFFIHPELNRRVYRSGDKGAVNHAGELLHLGRIDNQVKLRGFRIELEEISNQLLKMHPVVQAVTVLNLRRENDPASARIDAYVILDSEFESCPYAALREVLPEYMIPSSIYSVAKIPLTNNGKADTSNLNDHVLNVVSKDVNSSFFASPEYQDNKDSTDTLVIKEKLVDIWSELFEVEVTSNDNFFDLGGNSLFAIRMKKNLKNKGLPDIHLRELYQFQNIEALAVRVKELLG
ncbi:non-ribosomal peptide synthetase [Pleionea litopenaei]|uniref:Non-ribosomal peptide synthetase n=1 Tax=Pleionea litopenaei TaxID=3070815 RepID=A0AA51RTI6_9GAMM|nr:non-ribosomal peptide synthetase [Pleionea sp. HL-JVS1]WMS87315.1 non-ribosomal peptide synthetase [Pleionea sp. HL-JVS1]